MAPQITKVDPDEKLTLTDRLIEGYEQAKKPIAFGLMILIVGINSIPTELLPSTVREVTYYALVLALALILLNVLFDVYEKVVDVDGQARHLNLLPSGRLYEKISAAIEEEDYVDIKYIGVAGRFGWQHVLERLLDDSNPDSLISRKQTFDIGIALLNPSFIENDKNGFFEQYTMVRGIVRDIQEAVVHYQRNKGQDISVRFYDHMPNMVGFLVNDNYLYLSYVYWERVRGNLRLKAGGASYFVYDRNDDFGGQEVIKRFKGWWDFLARTSEAAHDTPTSEAFRKESE